MTPDHSPSVGGVRILDRLANQKPAVLAGCAMLVFLLLSTIAMVGESNTYDEAVHLCAGYSYLVDRDFRLNPEHPPLGKILAALPLLFLRLNGPFGSDAWRRGDEWGFGFQMLFQSGNDPELVLWCGRLSTLLWGVVLIGTVFHVSRTVHGPLGGLVSLFLVTFCPTILAHGHLVTTDVIVTTLFFLALVSIERLTQRVSLMGSVVSGVLVGATLLAKYSGIILLPILLWIAFTSYRRRRSGPSGADGAASETESFRSWLRGAIALLLFLFFAYVTVWAAYGFSFYGFPDGESWYGGMFTGGGIAGEILNWADANRILPRPYLRGLAMVFQHTREGHLAFAAGMQSPTGWWWYFPFALLVKMPVPSLVLCLWGVVASLRPQPGQSRTDHFLLAIVTYALFSIRASLNIGIRHLLPIFPMLFVCAGAVVARSSPGPGRRREILVGLLILGVAVEGIIAAPYYLSYFNFPSRSVIDRHHLLVDSNLDWGQDLRRLKRYVDREGIGEIKLAYFGTASPRHLNLRHQVLNSSSLYVRYEQEWKPALSIESGDVVAISATLYAGLQQDPKEPSLWKLRGLRPVAIVGHSILVFKVPPSR